MKRFIKIGILLMLFSYILNAEPIYKDTDTNLEWQDDSTSKELDWYQALEYCNILDLNGGGWRLPNINELHTIVNYASINPSAMGSFTYITNNYYWSSTTKFDNSQNALSISFANATMSYFNKETDIKAVRCVREITL